MALIEINNLEKVYKSGKMEYQALKGIDLKIEEGELTAIVGPSGCGKSTILNMITGIDRPTSGSVTIGGERIDTLRENQLAKPAKVPENLSNSLPPASIKLSLSVLWTNYHMILTVPPYVGLTTPVFHRDGSPRPLGPSSMENHPFFHAGTAEPNEFSPPEPVAY